MLVLNSLPILVLLFQAVVEEQQELTASIIFEFLCYFQIA